ncbi:hypothetical protein, partial [uncultured Dubosiella sp.]|uniref:hypothetical protein n=1 Tax=uncultured Dubosiella sp. TaxID=1937011 RepID=UPI00273096A0
KSNSTYVLNYSSFFSSLEICGLSGMHELPPGMSILGKKKQFMNRALKFSIERIKIDRLKKQVWIACFYSAI